MLMKYKFILPKDAERNSLRLLDHYKLPINKHLLKKTNSCYWLNRSHRRLIHNSGYKKQIAINNLKLSNSRNKLFQVANLLFKCNLNHYFIGLNCKSFLKNSYNNIDDVLLALDTVNKRVISKYEKEKIINSTLSFIHNFDQDFCVFLKSMVKNNLLFFDNSQKIEHSFCLNFPYSKLIYCYINNISTYGDIINLFHEIGHIYFYFHINRQSVYSNKHAFFHELVAYVFEYFLLSNISDDTATKSILVDEYRKKTASNLIYNLMYVELLVLKFNDMLKVNDLESKALELICMYNKINLSRDCDNKSVHIVKNNHEFIFDPTSFINYFFSQVYAVNLLNHNRNDLYKIVNSSLINCCDDLDILIESSFTCNLNLELIITNALDFLGN